VPRPGEAGGSAPSGEATALRPGGRTAEARRAFAEFFLALQREDDAAVSALLAPEVLIVRGNRRRRRGDLVSDLPRIFARLRLDLQPEGAVVDEAALRVFGVGEGGVELPAEATRPGDLIVTGPVRFRSSRPVREEPRKLVLRADGPRLLIVAVDRWSPVP